MTITSSSHSAALQTGELPSGSKATSIPTETEARAMLKTLFRDGWATDAQWDTLTEALASALGGATIDTSAIEAGIMDSSTASAFVSGGRVFAS